MGQQILIGDVGSEEGGVVRVERNQQARIEIAAQGVRGKRGANAGSYIGGGIEFEGRTAGFEFFNQRGVENGGECVADALGADGEGFVNSFRASGFAGVIGEAKAGRASFRIELGEGR